MSIESICLGSLFAHDFLSESIVDLDDWQTLDDTSLENLENALQAIFNQFPTARTPNESQTEDDLIWPVLALLGWSASLRQQNLSVHGHEYIPDGVLFAEQSVKDRANEFAEDWKRYEFGLAVVESKRWLRPLDRRSGRQDEVTAPSTQMLRYLRRVDDLTTGKLRWGILTNGAQWRLYYQGARSVSEQFCEIDLAALIQFSGYNDRATPLTDNERRHWLRVFVLIFGQNAFLPTAADERTFHQRAIEEGRFYEERVAANLSKQVFDQVFPELTRAIADSQPEAPLEDVREAVLILLYRLLFILYAEDRNLLPVRDVRYDDYALRDKVRGDVGRRKDQNDTFSVTAARYWSAIDDLCRAIDGGDSSIGLPPYNGGLFDQECTPLLQNIRLGDEIMANVIDALSFEQTPEGRRYINYRDLGVQQLGSIYERLLEHEIIREGGEIVVRLNMFARKGSGSYYTPDDLVGLIIEETIQPLVQLRMEAFAARAEELTSSKLPEERRIGRLKQIDPATKLLELKICDPAMGSGHFLVNLVDYLADRVIEAMAEAEATIENYVSPLAERIDDIRIKIEANAEDRNWTFDSTQLDDRHIIRRMVLKRCVYGVDKNSMAVELAKVSLWLHTFTVGAPLSFLDHHLQCGDSLFGLWVRSGIDRVAEWGGTLLAGEPVKRAMRAAAPMQIIEGLTDAEIAEAHRSADVFAEVKEMTTPLNIFLSLIHAFDWLHIRKCDDKYALSRYFDGTFGNPIDIALGRIEVPTDEKGAERFVKLLSRARQLLSNEHFLNWQVAFPGVWSAWEDTELNGGFDAIIGNPPWNRVKLNRVKWFETRRRDIALAQRAADRKFMISELEKSGDPLVQDFIQANERAAAATRVARTSVDYPLLSGGDINLYSLFVERAMTIIKPNGMVGLVVPVGIGADKTAAPFFSSISISKRLKSFLAFENKDRWLFKDVHAEDQPTAIIFGGTEMHFESFDYGVKMTAIPSDTSELVTKITSEDCQLFNPNTGTVPIFRDARRSIPILKRIYNRFPVLVDHSSGNEVKAWPVKYTTMFHMTNDSSLFRTREMLENNEDAYPIGFSRFSSVRGKFVPLCEGKSIQLFNHRYAHIRINEKSPSGQGVAEPLSSERLADPLYSSEPRYWINEANLPDIRDKWFIGFNDICNTNNTRSLIVAIVPITGYGNTCPLFLRDRANRKYLSIELLAANFGAIICDFIARQKIQSRHLSKYIIEQLPVIPLQQYEKKFGPKTAAEVVREIMLELTYTAHDMAPFARDLGYVSNDGKVQSPFVWSDERRMHLCAKLDAVFFLLYRIDNRRDISYIFSTFPKIEREETAAYGSYRSCELCLAWISALKAGDPDANIDL